VAVPPTPRLMLFWLREPVTPAGVVSASETFPEKLLMLVRVMVEVPDAVTRIVCDAGLAEMV